MKVLETDNVIKSNAVQHQTTYTIESNPKMFKLLSDNLYQDKIQSPIRELATNAYDAHLEAGTQKVPPDVHLPIQTEPYYSIRDYGTGLSYDQIKQLYSVYGRSNRSDSNDYIGCMGLGSKSPFAYTNSFTTTSYYNGHKYIFVNSINEHGIPTISHLLTEDTEEPNGLEIKFATKSGDIHKFYEAVAKVFSWFDIQPNFNITVLIDHTNSNLEGKGWSVGSSTIYNIAGRNYISINQCAILVMGNVAYNIKPDLLDSDTQEDKSTLGYQFIRSSRNVSDNSNAMKYKLLRSKIILYADIGTIDVGISREELQYTKQTVNTINSLLDNVIAQYQSTYNKQFAQCKDLFEARILFKKIKKNSVGFMLPDDLEYDGAVLYGDVSLHNQDGFSVSTFNKSLWRTSVQRRDHINMIDIVDNCMFVEKDISIGSYTRCIHALSNGEKHGQIYLVTFDTDTSKQKLLDLLGSKTDIFVKASSLVRPIRQKRNNVNTKHIQLIKLDYSSYKYSYREVKLAQVQTLDMDTGGLFIEINRRLLGDNYSFRSMAGLLFEFNRYFQQKPDVYAVKTKIIKKFRKHPKWQNAITYIKQYVMGQLPSKLDTLALDEWTAKYKNDLIFSNGIYVPIGSDRHMLDRFVRLLNKYRIGYKQRNTDNTRLKTFLCHCNIKIDIEITKSNNAKVKVLDGLYQACLKKYPIISSQLGRNNPDPQLLKYYVQLHDSLQSTKKGG